MSGTTAWVQESTMARRGGLEMADGGQLGADPRLGAGGLHYIYKWEYARVASLEWNVEQFGYPEIGDWKPVSTNVSQHAAPQHAEMGHTLSVLHHRGSSLCTVSVCRLKRRCTSSWSR